ncbi:MAG: hypothetical protein NW900_02240 [Candidatus Blochmannia sp. A2]|nr:hypothetical protein [Candidatus Blochmannia sp. A2]
MISIGSFICRTSKIIIYIYICMYVCIYVCVCKIIIYMDVWGRGIMINYKTTRAF